MRKILNVKVVSLALLAASRAAGGDACLSNGVFAVERTPGRTFLRERFVFRNTADYDLYFSGDFKAELLKRRGTAWIQFEQETVFPGETFRNVEARQALRHPGGHPQSRARPAAVPSDGRGCGERGVGMSCPEKIALRALTCIQDYEIIPLSRVLIPRTGGNVQEGV